MMDLTIAAFNLENLFTRYTLIDDPNARDNPRVVPSGITSINYQGNPLSTATTLIQRNHTARAILECRPDILGVEEVENLWTLRLFNDKFLGGYFGQLILIEGNDGRGIDVGLCIKKDAKARVTGIRTHVDELDPKRSDKTATSVQRYYSDSTGELTVRNALFSRDCLEVDIDVGVASQTVTPLTLLVNHFKAQDDKAASKVLRSNQAAKVVDYARAARDRGRKPIVLGDLNEDFSQNPSSLQPLKDVIGTLLTDPFQNEADNWTHFYDIANEVSRLDYVLVDQTLTVTAKSILRKGISLKCDQAGERYPGIGYVDTEASDHCPVSVMLELAD
jgi:hypothetical protein